MRSRYTAFVLDDRRYLLDTWLERTRPDTVAPPEPGLKWLGLEVRRVPPQESDHATVEFVARWRLPSGAGRLHEVSRFERHAGRWYYADGDLDVPEAPLRTPT